MDYANLIREYREKRNLTQEQLADFLQVSPLTVSRWERNEAVPKGRNRQRLEKILGRSRSKMKEGTVITVRIEVSGPTVTIVPDITG